MRKTLRKILLAGAFVLGSCISCNLFNFYPLNKDENHNGAIVYVYDDEGEEISETRKKNIFHNLTISEEIYNAFGAEITKKYSLNDWFQLQADKYDKKININLEEVVGDFKVPKKDLSAYKLRKYLEEENPSLANYDFLTLIKAREEGDPTGTSNANSRINIVYIKEGAVYYSIFAHEFEHLRGATDKYDDPSIDPKEIMKNTPIIYNLTDELFIGDITASEIGWN